MTRWLIKLKHPFCNVSSIPLNLQISIKYGGSEIDSRNPKKYCESRCFPSAGKWRFNPVKVNRSITRRISRTLDVIFSCPHLKEPREKKDYGTPSQSRPASRRNGKFVGWHCYQCRVAGNSASCKVLQSRFVIWLVLPEHEGEKKDDFSAHALTHIHSTPRGGHRALTLFTKGMESPIKKSDEKQQRKERKKSHFYTGRVITHCSVVKIQPSETEIRSPKLPPEHNVVHCQISDLQHKKLQEIETICEKMFEKNSIFFHHNNSIPGSPRLIDWLIDWLIE